MNLSPQRIHALRDLCYAVLNGEPTAEKIKVPIHELLALLDDWEAMYDGVTHEPKT